MKLKELAIVQGTPEQEQAHEKAVRNGVQDEGAAARVLGLPVTRCPLFIDPDMAANWRIGWHYEDSILSGRRDRKTGLLED